MSGFDVFLGLTKFSTDWFNNTVTILVECGAKTLADVEVLLTEAEFRKFCICLRVAQNPQINLWLQHPSTL